MRCLLVCVSSRIIVPAIAIDMTIRQVSTEETEVDRIAATR
jgi:hypothetical protein